MLGGGTSRGCAGLGNLYILTAVVVMIGDSNTRHYIRVDYGFQVMSPDPYAHGFYFYCVSKSFT